jgi:hypothetical protein
LNDTVTSDARFEIFMGVKIQVKVFRVVTAVGYQHFGGPCSLHLHPEDGGSTACCHNPEDG